MKIIDRLMNVFGYSKASRLYEMGTNQTYDGILGRPTQQNYRTYLQQYADVSWVYACVYRVATKGSGVYPRFYRKSKKGGKIVYDEVTDHPLITLLETANPLMSGVDLIEATLSYLELTGNAYWLLDMFINGKPTEIFPLNPHRITIKPHPKEYVDHYIYNVGGDRKTINYEKSIVLHFKYFNPLDDLYGISALSAGRLAVDTQNYGDIYNRNFFINSAEVKGALETEQELDNDQRKRIAAGWKAMHQGVHNAHKTVIFEKGLKWRAVGLNQRDMDFISGKKMTREDILGVFGMPPAMVGVFEYANYANAREQRKIFWIDTMIPKMKKIASVINSFLIKPFDESLEMEFDFSEVEVLRENEETKAKVDEILIRGGMKTINQAREERGWEKVAWGETWNAPMNLMPITSPKPEPTPPKDEGKIIEIKDSAIELKPYPNEHACRLQNPKKYDRFARQNCKVKVDEKCIDYIFGVKEGKSELQAMRYNKDIWTTSAAKNHCKEHEGTFEEASGKGQNEPQGGKTDDSEGDEERAREKVINDKIWQYFKLSTEAWERKFKPILRGEFTGQEKETIRNLRDYGWKKLRTEVLGVKKENVKQKIDVILFNEKEASKSMRKSAKPIVKGSLADQAKKEIARLGLEIDFDVDNPEVIEWIDKKLFKFPPEVNKVTRENLRDQLKIAIAEGEGIKDVEKRIERVFDMARGYRTERIARTEMISSSNNGTMSAYKQSGVVEKKSWISSRDGDVRPSHQIDGEEVGLDEPFSNGLMYPGDPAGGPEEICNCRCSFKGVVKV